MPVSQPTPLAEGLELRACLECPPLPCGEGWGREHRVEHMRRRGGLEVLTSVDRVLYLKGADGVYRDVYL